MFGGCGLCWLTFSANVLMRNDDGQTALDVARTKGHTGVVRVLEVILPEFDAVFLFFLCLLKDCLISIFFSVLFRVICAISLDG